MKNKIIYISLLIIIFSSCSVFYNENGDWKYPLLHTQTIKLKNPSFKKELVDKYGNAIIYSNAIDYYNAYYTPEVLSLRKTDYIYGEVLQERLQAKSYLDSIRPLLNNKDSIQIMVKIPHGDMLYNSTHYFTFEQINKRNVRIFNIKKGKYVDEIVRKLETYSYSKGWSYYFIGDTLPFLRVQIIHYWNGL